MPLIFQYLQRQLIPRSSILHGVPSLRGSVRCISRAAKTESSATVLADENEKSKDLKTSASAAKKQIKTMAEADEELRQKLEDIAGDGGQAGMELEDGKPVAMKRGVRDNMFRYI
ncbi:MAG: hypothetical protein M1834_007607 [Cirrosporium novae-zelandiae]|nr:MAG: hypothetical protein M1834_007607 [Cirrosporium novae-zelandiae]